MLLLDYRTDYGTGSLWHVSPDSVWTTMYGSPHGGGGPAVGAPATWAESELEPFCSAVAAFTRHDEHGMQTVNMSLKAGTLTSTPNATRLNQHLQQGMLLEQPDVPVCFMDHIRIRIALEGDVNELEPLPEWCDPSYAAPWDWYLDLLDILGRHPLDDEDLP